MANILKFARTYINIDYIVYIQDTDYSGRVGYPYNIKIMASDLPFPFEEFFNSKESRDIRLTHVLKVIKGTHHE